MLFLGEGVKFSLTVEEQRCKLTVRRGGFIVCPECERRHAANPAWPVNKSLIRIDGDTRAEGLPVLCRKCQCEIKLDIAGQSAFESRSQ